MSINRMQSDLLKRYALSSTADLGVSELVDY